MSTRTISAAVVAALMAIPCGLSAQQPAEAWWRHVQVLANDSLKGRDTGSPGHEAAARYVAEQFRLAGLTPAGTEGWYQPVRFIEVGMATEGVALALHLADAVGGLRLAQQGVFVGMPATGACRSLMK